MVEREYSIPKYYRIRNEIIDKIKSRQLLPGDQIPSENEIVKNYKVSNTTARKVLHEIELGGWASRVKGKGTFVKDFVVHRSANKILSFTNNMVQKGLQPTTRFLDGKFLKEGIRKTISDIDYEITGPVYQITRLRYANGIPMMKEIRYINLKLCPGIDKLNLERSLYEVYKKSYNLYITKIEQMLTSVILNDEILEVFKLTHNIPGFFVEGVTYHENDRILEMEESIYRGDKYTFSVQAVP